MEGYIFLNQPLSKVPSIHGLWEYSSDVTQGLLHLCHFDSRTTRLAPQLVASSVFGMILTSDSSIFTSISGTGAGSLPLKIPWHWSISGENLIPLTTRSALGWRGYSSARASVILLYLQMMPRKGPIETGSGVSSQMTFRSIGLQVPLLCRSLSFTEPFTYVSKTKSIRQEPLLSAYSISRNFLKRSPNVFKGDFMWRTQHITSMILAVVSWFQSASGRESFYSRCSSSNSLQSSLLFGLVMSPFSSKR